MTDEVQISSRSTQLRSAGDTILINDKMDSSQIRMIDEVQKKTAPAELPPTVKLFIETPKLEGRRLDIPHKYNTRRACYKKKISNFIVQEQELLNRLRKNQQRPKAKDASTPHDQWLHSKDWVNINLLKVNIPIKKGC
ncbi:unnamed protein product [Macrosiphum euphorbiae]|uniref:Uncharacterized protein n=1 Tax=Macrosiphum euphorbiae TaxID=13131 RepID=A0AAV0WTK7_9HEMI|nr:unnamed protein product [Macrosiphum euphorbiae]